MPAPAAAAPPRAAADLTHLRSVRSEALLGEEAARSVRPTGNADDLKRIRGIGVLIEKKLNSLGIGHYEQIANWTGADIERISQILDFKGRIERENWIEQARILATGGQTEFSRRGG
jgi:predicted flap endonuclease-1-like 5' DNA nuclease